MIHDAPYAWEFRYKALDCSASIADVLSLEAERVLVLPHTQFLVEGRLVSEHRPILLSSLLVLLPEVASHSSTEPHHEQKHRKRAAEQHLPEYQWLQAHLKERQPAERPSTKRSSSGSQGQRLEANVVEPDVPPLDMDLVWQQLEEKRSEWADSGASDSFLPPGERWCLDRQAPARGLRLLDGCGQKGSGCFWAPQCSPPPKSKDQRFRIQTPYPIIIRYE